MVDISTTQGGDFVGRDRTFDDLLDFLAREAVGDMEADRSSIFLLDEARQELWSRVALGMGQQILRFPSNRGIAGHVATTGEVLNVQDPYADARFNPAVDRQTGYRTRSILCGPLRARDGRIVGVLQVLNKRGDGPFVADDVKRFERVSTRCALAIENALTYDRLRQAEAGGQLVLTATPKVLVADADATIVGKIRELLEDDLTVLHAVDLSELIATAEDSRPDIVLLSVGGDGRDGVTACKLLRSCPAIGETPIIVLTPPGHPEHVVAAIEAGANDYLLRPFAPAQLRAKTHTWLLRSGSGPTR
ncbi:MAG: GAF domain-containing protein [Chloroflexi bacterium]|nr:GAF domain-containing protein [Chloroflexota bacterium]